MTLKEGIYEIRYVPEHIKLPFMGGAYATADNINAPVRAEGMNPQAVTGTQHVGIPHLGHCHTQLKLARSHSMAHVHTHGIFCHSQSH